MNRSLFFSTILALHYFRLSTRTFRSGEKTFQKGQIGLFAFSANRTSVSLSPNHSPAAARHSRGRFRFFKTPFLFLLRRALSAGTRHRLAINQRYYPVSSLRQELVMGGDDKGLSLLLVQLGYQIM
jgi:hypothetical protein